MYRKLSAVLILLCVASTASAAVSVTFNQDENGYTGTIDAGFYYNSPATPHPDDVEVSLDEDDGGPTQGAIRFANLFQNEGGPIPTSNVTIGFAELYLWADDPANADSVIEFHRVLGASPWDENSTWQSLGGGLVPDGTGVLAKPILYDDVEAISTPEFLIPDPAADEAAFTFDVTEAVQSWADGAANLGWAGSQDTTAGWDFSSSEEVLENEQPRLTVVYYQTGLLADIDGDSDVDTFDYELLLDNLASHLDAPILPGAGGDLDFDRDIDLDDFGIFKSEYPGGAGALEAAIAGVPEPSVAVLVVLALCSFACGRSRKAS